MFCFSTKRAVPCSWNLAFLSQDELGLNWVVTSRPAPTSSKESKVIINVALPGTPRDFYDAVLMDSSTFLEDFMEGAGERRINLSHWRRHEQLGHVRDLQFNSPVKGAFSGWGVGHAQCYQSQR